MKGFKLIPDSEYKNLQKLKRHKTNDKLPKGFFTIPKSLAKIWDSPENDDRDISFTRNRMR